MPRTTKGPLRVVKLRSVTGQIQESGYGSKTVNSAVKSDFKCSNTALGQCTVGSQSDVFGMLQ